MNRSLRDDGIPLGAGPDGTVVTFPLSELNKRVAERDANDAAITFAMGLSEAVAIAEALEGQEKAAAKERQKQHGGTAPGRKNSGGKLPQVKGKTRDIVAKATGKGARTF